MTFKTSTSWDSASSELEFFGGVTGAAGLFLVFVVFGGSLWLTWLWNACALISMLFTKHECRKQRIHSYISGHDPRAHGRVNYSVRVKVHDWCSEILAGKAGDMECYYLCMGKTWAYNNNNKNNGNNCWEFMRILDTHSCTSLWL